MIEFSSSVGTFLIVLLALIGLGVIIYALHLGFAQIFKQQRLGEACVKEADAVMDDVRQPAIRGIGR